MAHYAQDPLFQWFRAVDRDGSGQIDQFELQTALTQSGMNGNWKPFSPETCRLMIAMLDRDQNGTLNFEEFKNLWNIINGWKQVFMQADRDRSGFIDVNELSACVRQLGYNLSPHTINAMAKRHSDNSSKQLSFDDFTACIVRMRALTGAFRGLDRQQTGVVQMPYDQFLYYAFLY